LSLVNFRNHRSRCIDTAADVVLLNGANGSGKTSIMESISLFTPGRGICNAVSSTILNNDVKNGAMDDSEHAAAVAWQVSMRYVGGAASDLIEDEDRLRLECYLGDATSGVGGKKLYINDNAVQSRVAILDMFNIVWLTPRMDYLLYDASSDRRKFLDRIVYNFVADHAKDCALYDKQSKSRLKMLHDRYGDDRWVSAIEHSMSGTAVMIAIRRVIVVRCVNAELPRSISNSFSNMYLDIVGDVEKLVSGFVDNFCKHLSDESNDHGDIGVELLYYTNNDVFMDIIDADDELCSAYTDIKNSVMCALREKRYKDRISHRSHYGVNRSDLLVYNAVLNDILAKYCSVGEQKSMLISLLIAQIVLLERYSNIIARKWGVVKKGLVVLLDDILSHLDDNKRRLFIEILNNLEGQVWITGTDLVQYKHLFNRCVLIDV